jgi:putative phage-type endonuclease
MMIQGSEEWRLARCGWVGASRVADIIAKTKSGWSASRANYMAQLIAERLTGKPMETFTSEAMQWGTETEDKARTIYAFMYDAEIEQTGFVKHPRIPMAGASPDGFIGDAGLLEIKCPNTATHIDTLLGHSVPGKYVTQMQFQMACTGRSWCDFVSYDPRLPEHMSLFVHRVPRDDRLIGELEDQVERFLAELDAKLTQLNERFAVREAA